MAQIFIGYPHIAVTGATITTGAASASATIPNNSAGVKPRFIRLSATAAAVFRMGAGAQTAVSTDCQVQPGDSLICVVPSGVDTIAALQVAAAGVFNITPLENS